jgi:hypothetical protein
MKEAKLPQGFAVIPKARCRAIQSAGGKARSRDRAEMSRIGRIGAKWRWKAYRKRKAKASFCTIVQLRGK